MGVSKLCLIKHLIAQDRKKLLPIYIQEVRSFGIVPIGMDKNVNAKIQQVHYLCIAILIAESLPWIYENPYTILFMVVFRYLGALSPSTDLFTHYVACDLTNVP